MAVDNIEPSKLLLDINNPRFGLSSNTSQEDALQYLFETSDIKELWFSIMENGFLTYEPLVAYQPDPDVEKYIVVEGNRRLAAVLSLLDPAIISAFSKAGVPTVPPEHTDSLDKLPVTIITHPDDADEYIGFRHVNGSRNWEPLAKARFGLRLLNKLRERSKKSGENKSDKEIVTILARQIGDQPTQMTRNLFAYKVLQQAMELQLLQDDFLEKTKNDFSHLYSILSNPATRGYIGLGHKPLKPEQIQDNPIPPSHARKLEFLMTWLFGSADGETPSVILSQGRDRPILQKIIASPDGLITLEETGDFLIAKSMAGINIEDWMSAVFDLSNKTKRVWDDIVDDISSEDKVKATKSLQSTISRITKIVRVLEE